MKPTEIAAYWAKDAQTKADDFQHQIDELDPAFSRMRAELIIGRDDYLSEARHWRQRIAGAQKWA